VANDRDMLRTARLPILIEVARLNIVAVNYHSNVIEAEVNYELKKKGILA